MTRTSVAIDNAIRALREDGRTYEDIAGIVNLSRSTIYRRCNAVRAEQDRIYARGYAAAMRRFKNN